VKTNLLGLDAAGLAGFFAELGEKPFRVRQVLRWVHQRRESDFTRMSDLAKGLRDKLAAQACVEAPRIVGDTLAEDGTRKWLLKVDGANAVLAEIEKHEATFNKVKSELGTARAEARKLRDLVTSLHDRLAKLLPEAPLAAAIASAEPEIDAVVAP